MRLTDKQTQLLSQIVEDFCPKTLQERLVKAQLVKKFGAPEAQCTKTPKPSLAPPIPSAGAVEEILVQQPSKVVATIASSPAFWIKVYKVIKAKGVTLEQASLVREWLLKQTWLTGTLTIESVLNRWEGYLSRATAELGQTSDGEGSCPDNGAIKSW